MCLHLLRLKEMIKQSKAVHPCECGGFVIVSVTCLQWEGLQEESHYSDASQHAVMWASRLRTLEMTC